MKAIPIPADEQYQLVMECRSSGLSDHQWCMEHGIKPGTFYNWVKRLRKKGYADIPKAGGRGAAPMQEIVKVEITPPVDTGFRPVTASGHRIPALRANAAQEIPIIEIEAAGLIARIPGGADPCLVEQVIRLLMETAC